MTGEEWLVKKVGAYLPGAYEEVVDVVDAYVLTEKVQTCYSNCVYAYSIAVIYCTSTQVGFYEFCHPECISKFMH